MRALIITMLSLLAVSSASAQENPAPKANPAVEKTPMVTIEELHVSPENLGPDLLCRLAITLKNQGERTVSQLAFRVELAGMEVPVYRNQVFMEALPPGESKRIDLYNFWTTETGRAAPKGKEYSIKVSLTGAKWYRIEQVEEDGESIEEWSPLEEVAGLPASRSLDLPWKTQAKKAS